ncbi:MAG: RNA-binding protein [Caldithrix sp. RBG_13_44_9]|nr:MAG: RNA-binding protein [Caldithrix sp. RBG_13_44_9]
MKELIELIVKNLVDKPEEVVLTEVVGQSITVFELRVGQGDLGKVIGKHGHTARAIRTIINAVGAKHKRGVILEILE